MADSKKYDGSTWEHSLRKMTTASEIIVPPTTIYADGSNITAYTIKGNTVQNGTPIPTNPIAVNGVGELDSGDYKIPISSGGVTTNIYLTEQLMKINDAVDSLSSSGSILRANTKYVFTGTENITENSIYYQVTLSKQSLDRNEFVCTHFGQGAYSGAIAEGNARFTGSTVNILFNFDDGVGGAENFKGWLAQQYANGTPVTLYYALATPTTETVTAPSIPTTEGTNNITVDTTVQPSEFTATWTGWHDASVKEWDGSDWQ